MNKNYSEERHLKEIKTPFGKQLYTALQKGTTFPKDVTKEPCIFCRLQLNQNVHCWDGRDQKTAQTLDKMKDPWEGLVDHRSDYDVWLLFHIRNLGNTAFCNLWHLPE